VTKFAKLTKFASVKCFFFDLLKVSQKMSPSFLSYIL